MNGRAGMLHSLAELAPPVTGSLEDWSAYVAARERLIEALARFRGDRLSEAEARVAGQALAHGERAAQQLSAARQQANQESGRLAVAQRRVRDLLHQLRSPAELLATRG